MAIPTSFQVPFREPIEDGSGILTRPWEYFFRFIQEALDPLGTEKTDVILNNQAAPKSIAGLAFTSAKVSHVIVDYVIQRITTGGGAVELLQGGCFHLVYKPTSNSWSLVTIGTPGPHISGVTLSVNSSGEVYYTSTNVAGTASISRIIFRSRTLGGKSSQYSSMGGGR